MRSKEQVKEGEEMETERWSGEMETRQGDFCLSSVELKGRKRERTRMLPVDILDRLWVVGATARVTRRRFSRYQSFL